MRPVGGLNQAQPEDLLGRQRGQLVPVETEGTARADHARDGPQERGLPRAVAAHQGDDLARPDQEPHAGEHRHLPVAGAQGADLQQRRGHCRLLPRYASITRGSRSTWSVGPSAICWPWWSTRSRSASRRIAFITCSMTRMVTPLSRIFLISSTTWSTSTE